MPTVITGTAKDFADRLFDVGGIKFGKFTLVGGDESPIYIDLRLIRSDHSLRYLAVKLLNPVTRLLEFDVLADIPTAATPIVAILAHVKEMVQITPRKPKKHGTKASIDGIYKKGQTALVIDDLITTAGSKVEAIKILEDAGLIVRDVLVLVDRGQGGKEELMRRGYNLHAIFQLTELLKYYLEAERIDQGRYDEVMAYLSG